MALAAAVIMVVAVVTISSGPSQDLPKLISALHVHGKTQALQANKRVVFILPGFKHVNVSSLSRFLQLLERNRTL